MIASGTTIMLALEFTDKLRLTEFLEKSRELFPDTTLQVVSWLRTGITPLPNGSLQRHRLLPMAPAAIDSPFLYMAQQSCMSRMEELSNGRTTRTKLVSADAFGRIVHRLD
jgi:hypothetical protein